VKRLILFFYSLKQGLGCPPPPQQQEKNNTSETVHMNRTKKHKAPDPLPSQLTGGSVMYHHNHSNSKHHYIRTRTHEIDHADESIQMPNPQGSNLKEPKKILFQKS
jgi:hypothetical protein